MRKLFRYFKICSKWVLGIIIALVILFKVLGTCLSWLSYQTLKQEKFNSIKWKKALSEKNLIDMSEYRCGMYDDLIKKHLKKGMSLHEVEEMLGKVRIWTYCKARDTGIDIKCATYFVGKCGRENFKLVYLIYVCFDQQDRLVIISPLQDNHTLNNSYPRDKEQVTYFMDYQRCSCSMSAEKHTLGYLRTDDDIFVPTTNCVNCKELPKVN